MVLETENRLLGFKKSLYKQRRLTSNTIMIHNSQA